MRLRRWSAIIVGFLGVLIILRPGASIIEPGAIWAVGAACLFAVNALTIKSMTRTESPQKIVAWTAVLLSLATLPLALTVWVPMTGATWTGALVITGAALYVARREAQLAKQPTRAQPD